MRRIILLVAVALLMVAMLVVGPAAPAAAAAGCQEFGVDFTAFEAQLEGREFGETVSGVPPGSTDETLNSFKAAFCSPG
jgi:hypothetical protein